MDHEMSSPLNIITSNFLKDKAIPVTGREGP
jgi:hypothetical protein